MRGPWRDYNKARCKCFIVTITLNIISIKNIVIILRTSITLLESDYYSFKFHYIIDSLVVAPLIIAAIAVLVALLLLTAWYNSQTQACMNNLNLILKHITDMKVDPDNTDVYCLDLKKAVTLFENDCSELSAPAYESYVPPCK